MRAGFNVHRVDFYLEFSAYRRLPVKGMPNKVDAAYAKECAGRYGENAGYLAERGLLRRECHQHHITTASEGNNRYRHNRGRARRAQREQACRDNVARIRNAGYRHSYACEIRIGCHIARIRRRRSDWIICKNRFWK